MTYSQDDKHIIVNALKKKGWKVFDIMYANKSNGVHSGWRIECSPTFSTEYYESHKAIDGKWLGLTIREAMETIKSDNFPTNSGTKEIKINS